MPINREFDHEKAIWCCEEISKDMANDASRFDGKEFNGKNVAEYFGNQGAAISALSNIVKQLVEYSKIDRDEAYRKLGSQW